MSNVSLPVAAPRKTGTQRAPRALGRAIRYLLLICLTLLFLVPLYVMISASLKTSHDAGLAQMWNPPIPLDIEGLGVAWSRLSANLLNSAQMALPAVIISSLIGSLNGYLLTKVRFPFSNALLVVVVVGMYIPFQAVLIPMVQFLQGLHLYGTIPGLVLVHVIYGLPITTVIFRDYYIGIPSDLVEAAQIDGAGVIRTYLNIFLPLSPPGFVVAGIFQFTNIWNDFLFGLVVIPDGTRQPITVALNNLSGTTSVDWNVVMGGALITAIPTLLVYIFLGRYFVRGLIAGSYR
ncbi:MAG: carbohydrate ABC transporter permease [Bifidobacteriaceae bacterium]|jgi:glucose/mannose transport system permease protein|nr:carbohydrate ABC transporter permease [Bifidobacteriaceae bacterium]